MDTQETVRKLSSLVQLDIDAVHAYREAIEKADNPVVRENLSLYRQDHERYITDFSAEIRRLGASRILPRFQGLPHQRIYLNRHGGALHAMRTNEKLTNKEYEAAKYWDVSPELKQMIALAREDERRHLEYIERALQDKTP